MTITTPLRQLLPLSPALVASLALFGCDGGSSSGTERANPRVAEVETTIERSGDITIQRSEYVYEGSFLKEIRFIENGSNDGRLEFSWNKKKIDEVLVIDEEGDRATYKWSYSKGKPSSVTYSVPSLSSVERSFEYDKSRGGREKQITTVSSRIGVSGTDTRYQYFRYNEDDMLEEVDNIDDGDSLIEELRYDSDKRLERATRYRNNNHLDTYDFEYGPDGRLEELVGSDNDRYSLAYDDLGNVTKTTHVGTSGATVTVRYTYESGTMPGFTVAPHLPYGQLLDLKGQSYGSVEFQHLAFSAPGDIPRALGDSNNDNNGDDKDNDDNNDNQCSDYTAENVCGECLIEECCFEVRQCESVACDNFLACRDDCTDQGCVDYCAELHPTGSSQFAAYLGCAQSWCGSPCDL